ncbi:hypothetical protein SEPCBS119000_005713 [Sporothrix epigloea]|uniref:AA1-like domain-containing protein n=1 Tax=Sporothrix epigloea TaxID=1892477 RepID=A0ABP0DZ21_9PEZI
MFFTLHPLKALPLALMLSTALANPVPETLESSIDKRIIGNDATYLHCVAQDYQCGFFATYTNGQTRETVKWTIGSPASTGTSPDTNQDLCQVNGFIKQTNSDGFWLNRDLKGLHVRFTIGYNPTGKKIKFGQESWKSTDQDYLNGRCENEFGSEFANVLTDHQSEELTWNDLSTKLY